MMEYTSQELHSLARPILSKIERRISQLKSGVIPLTGQQDVTGLAQLADMLKDALAEAGIDGLAKTIYGLFKDYPILETLADEAATPGKYTPVTLLEMAKRPRPAWIVEGWIYEGTVSALYGEAGCKKTFTASDLAACIAMGLDWQGRQVLRGKVVYLLAEGADSFITRMLAWAKYHNVTFEDLSDNLFLIPQEVPLSNTAEVQAYIENVSEFLYNVAPRLIIFDTLMRCSGGQNINAPEIMQALYDGANRARRDLRAGSALIVHHEGKDRSKGAAGSFVLRASCDCVYHQTVDADGIITLSSRHEAGGKMKDKPEIETWLTTRVVALDSEYSEQEDTSLVIVSSAKPEQPVKAERLSPSQTALLSILDAHTTIAYAVWLKAFEATGGIKSTFNQARNALLTKSIIEQYENENRQMYKRVGTSFPSKNACEEPEELSDV